MDATAAQAAILALPIPDTTYSLADTQARVSIDAHNPQHWTITVELGFPCQTTIDAWRQMIIQICQPQPVTVVVMQCIATHQVQTGLKPIANIANIIAVASGKGGVGKSTVSVNLALALQQQGARVGLLDADIYGPSQPHLLGTQQAPQSPDGKRMLPVISHGLASMSIGYLIATDTAMIWRGPMVTGALQQLLQETQWPVLDYLIIDCPPGTGDIQLTMAQKIPLAASLLVTTPQDLALLDVQRAYQMWQKVNVSTLGIVANMATYNCPHCGASDPIFGDTAVTAFSQQQQLPVLAQIPLARRIRQLSDQGVPLVAFEPESELAQVYHHLARRVAVDLSTRPKTYVHKFPKIQVQAST